MSESGSFRVWTHLCLLLAYLCVHLLLRVCVCICVLVIAYFDYNDLCLRLCLTS